MKSRKVWVLMKRGVFCCIYPWNVSKRIVRIFYPKREGYKMFRAEIHWDMSQEVK